MPAMKRVAQMREILRQAGFYMLGVFSLLYVVFSQNFAEIRVQPAFLSFPVFIGEIFLFFCFILSLFVFDYRSIKGRQWWLVFYFACIGLKALWGYIQWGPLALRHAALFYYLVFIFFGFIFYKRSLLYEPFKILAVLLIFALCATKYFYGYWVFTLWAIAFILIRSLADKKLRYILSFGLLLAIYLSYKYFILTSRTFTVGNIAAVFFLAISLLCLSKIRILYKAAIAGAVLILLTVFVSLLPAFNAAVGTIFDIKNTLAVYKMTDAEINELKRYFTPQLLEVKLFNPENTRKKNESLSEKIPAGLVLPRDRRPHAELAYKRNEALFNMIMDMDNNGSAAEKRTKGIAYGNSMFRIFIWRDLLSELRQHPILGFSFGRPFRSESMEILYQANGEWQRDGWIEPHNSYLNIIYRLGILGIMLIAFLIRQFCRMVKGFIAFRSLSGVLLCSILVDWLVAANFLPILELPYNAIPFWALWGVTLGYLKELENKRRPL